uniref:Uncharacterized protein n=1 Tax=Oryza brachyantha TaxID=4533 RepID=J3LET9_ORYBR
MSNSGRRRRSPNSIAPSPVSCSSSPPGSQEAQAPSQLPSWKFSQVLGELPLAAAGAGHDSGTLQVIRSRPSSSTVRASTWPPATTLGASSSSGEPTRATSRRRLVRSWSGRTTPLRRRGGGAGVQLHGGVPEPRAGVRRAAQLGDRREGEEAEMVRAAEQLVAVHAHHQRPHRQTLEASR